MSNMVQSALGPNFQRPKLDWAWALILLSPLVWLILSENGYLLYHHHQDDQIVSLPRHVADSFLHIAPYFAFAIALGAYAVASDCAELVNRAFRYNQPLAIALAAVAGAASPLCSCGVIPLIAAMLIARVPLAPIMAFWLASPLMAPEQYALTQSFLGMPFAVAKTGFAFIIGAVGGYVTYALSFRLDFSAERVLRPGVMPQSCCGSSTAAPQEKSVLWAIWRAPERRVLFIENLWSTALFLGKWLMLAFVLEALMLQLNVVEPLVGIISGTGNWAIPFSALIGIPAYLNGDAAPALISTFVEAGLSQGAAMAFLIGGGVTCIPAAVAVWSLVRPQVFGLYLLYGLGGAICAGFISSALL